MNLKLEDRCEIVAATIDSSISIDSASISEVRELRDKIDNDIVRRDKEMKRYRWRHAKKR